MAMSDTMSSRSSPSSADWAQLYQLNLTGPAEAAPQHDATVVTTTVTSATATAPAALSPEGRVSKPPRRRRASRAAPTTLLNTDTTNFRAMVQQFTGVPSAAFTFGTAHNQMSGPSLSFGLAQQQQQQQQQQQHQINVGVGPHHQSGYNYINNNRYQQQQQQRFYNQQQQYVFPFSSDGGEHIVGFGSDISARASNMEMTSDGYVMDGQDHHHHHHVFHHGSSSDGNRTSSHGYNLGGG